MHLQVSAVMIYFLKGKVIHSFLNSTRVCYYESVHPRLDLRGRDDVRFIYTGSEEMTRTDGWKCFVLQRMQAAVTTVSCPWMCISVASSVSIQLSITKSHVCFCTSDTWALPPNVYLIFSTDTVPCMMTMSVQWILSKNEQCTSWQQ